MRPVEAPRPMQSKPNIIFIVADDLGYADLSCCGPTDFTTPNLDEIAREGTRFTQAYARAPLCTNTRVALMTGRYQYRLKLGLTEPLRHSRVADPEMGLPESHPTLPSQLRAAGYDTALIGKWHLGALPLFGPLKSGYEEFTGIMGVYTGYFTRIGDGDGARLVGDRVREGLAAVDRKRQLGAPRVFAVFVEVNPVGDEYGRAVRGDVEL